MGTSRCSTCATSTSGGGGAGAVPFAPEQPAAISSAITISPIVVPRAHGCFHRIFIFLSDHAGSAAKFFRTIIESNLHVASARRPLAGPAGAPLNLFDEAVHHASGRFELGSLLVHPLEQFSSLGIDKDDTAEVDDEAFTERLGSDRTPNPL